MEEIGQVLDAYGYPLLFALDFLEFIGLHVASTFFLAAAGAFAASGTFSFPGVVASVALGGLLADSIWFALARMGGEKLVGFLTGQWDAHMDLLTSHFNPATLSGLMCRSLRSIGWNGAVFDCDFNQMLGLPVRGGAARTIWDLSNLDDLSAREIVTGDHCFGCTAGAGSSCSGALQ